MAQSSPTVRILLVEDSERLQRSVGTALKKSGYAVDVASNGEDGLWLAQSNDYDAVVLDVMLPKLDGLSVLTRLRAEGRSTHVLLLTARDAVQDRVRGLRAGADDYLVKPFALEELLARVEALCRRGYGIKHPRIAMAPLEIDTAAKEAWCLGRRVELKPREFALLEYLTLRAGEVVTRSEIEAHLYDDRLDPSSNVIDSAISVLRKRLAQAGAPEMIQTRRGHGYILTGSAS